MSQPIKRASPIDSMQFCRFFPRTRRIDTIHSGEHPMASSQRFEAAHTSFWVFAVAASRHCFYTFLLSVWLKDMVYCVVCNTMYMKLCFIELNYRKCLLIIWFVNWLRNYILFCASYVRVHFKHIAVFINVNLLAKAPFWYSKFPFESFACEYMWCACVLESILCMRCHVIH